MARYLYGSVIVRTVEINCENEKEALALLKNTKYEGKNKVKTEYKLHWGEVPTSDIVVERDGVLAEFLTLMTNIIPRPILPKNNVITPTIFRALPAKQISTEEPS